MSNDKPLYYKTECDHCHSTLYVATCSNSGCQRQFIITESHLKDKPRQYEDDLLKTPPSDFVPRLCDFCTYKKIGMSMESIKAGLRQRTCPHCKAECLAAG